MRSSLLLFTAVSLALTACGKSVDKTGRLQGQMAPGLNGVSASGACIDPLENISYRPVARFAEVAHAGGTYSLTSFQAVGIGTSTVTPGVSGISVVSGGMGNERGRSSLQFQRVCTDLSRMPQENFRWSVRAPFKVGGADGRISQELSFSQRAIGPQASGMNSNLNGSSVATGSLGMGDEERLVAESAKECLSAEDLLQISPQQVAAQGTSQRYASGCGGARFFQIDATSIGILRIVETYDSRGMKITSKVFAQYTLNAPVAAAPEARIDEGSLGGERVIETPRIEEKKVHIPREVPTTIPRVSKPKKPSKMQVADPIYIGCPTDCGKARVSGRGFQQAAPIYVHAAAPVVIAQPAAARPGVIVVESTDGDLKLKYKSKEKEKTKIVTDDATVTTKRKSKEKLKISIDR